MKRKWRENEEIEREIHSQDFLIPYEEIILGRIRCEEAPQVLPAWLVV